MADIESNIRKYSRDGTLVYLKINGMPVIDDELLNDSEALELAEELMAIATELVSAAR